MPNITVNVTENPDSVLKTLEETIPENSLDSLISALKTIKETSNAYMTELVNRQNSTEAPAQTSKTGKDEFQKELSDMFIVSLISHRKPHRRGRFGGRNRGVWSSKFPKKGENIIVVEIFVEK